MQSLRKRKNCVKQEEEQQGEISERSIRMLQKRDAERNRYRQITGEAKARMLQKKRDAKRSRYSQVTGEEKAKLLQKKRDAERNRYSQMTDEEKVRMLHKSRFAKRNRYNKMTDEEKARMLQKKRIAARSRYSQMTDEEKARMLQRKKEARQMKLCLMESDENVRMIQMQEDQERPRKIKMEEDAEMVQKEMCAEQRIYMRMTNEKGMMVENDSWQSGPNQMESEEGARTQQSNRDAKQSIFHLMTHEEKESAKERRINDAKRSRFSNSLHVTSDLTYEENMHTATIWGQSGEKSTFLCNQAVSCELDKSVFIGSMHVVCDYCQAKKWKGEGCGVCCSNGKVQLQPVAVPCAVLTALPSGTDQLLQHIEMYSCDLQMASLGVSTKDNIDVIKVECNVDIETESKSEDCLTDADQGQVPFSFISVKQELEESWAVTAVKEEQIDEITKEEQEICFEGGDKFPNEQDDRGYTALQLDPCLGHDQKYAVEDVINKDMNLVYMSTVRLGDNLNYSGQNVNKTDFELSSYQIISEKEIEHPNIQIIGQTYKCGICRKYFAEEEKLINHQDVHTTERPFKCEICNKLFSQKGGLNKHKRVHTGEKRYRCNSCNKRFLEKSHLDRHQRTHTGEKPFKCEICNNSFTQKGSLDSHLRMHSGEKHFKCEICSKYFTRSSYLAVHQRIHTGEKPYTCEFCNNRFRCRGNLVSHIRTHTGNKAC